jgi:hypothetical protein
MEATMSNDVSITPGGIKIAADLLSDAPNTTPEVPGVVTPENALNVKTAEEAKAIKALKNNPPKAKKSARKVVPKPAPIAPIALGDALVLHLANADSAGLKELAAAITTLAKTRGKAKKQDTSKAIEVLKKTFTTYEGNWTTLVQSIPAYVVPTLPRGTQDAIATVKAAGDSAAAVTKELHDALSSVKLATWLVNLKVGDKGFALGRSGKVKGNRANSDGTTSADFPTPFLVKSVKINNKLVKLDRAITSPDGLVSFLTSYAWDNNFDGLKDKHPTKAPSRGIRGTLGATTQHKIYWKGNDAKTKTIAHTIYGKPFEVTIA